MTLALTYGAPSTRSAPDPTPATMDSPAVFEPVVQIVPSSWWTHRIFETGWRSWLEDAQYRIKEAFQLNEDWDHEGAKAVSRAAASSAVEIARWLNGLHVRKPLVSPTQDGGIGFEWLGGPLEVHIEVLGEDWDVTVRDPETGAFWEGDPETFQEKFSDAMRSLVR